MTLASIGEFGAIGLFQELLQSRTWPGWQPVVGIGDDAAVWRPTPGRCALQTTDLLVEEVHFSLRWSTWHDVGWKAMAVNVSDVAAMGGVPRAAFVSVGLRPGMARDDAAALYGGLADCAERCCLRILGGDTVSSPAAAVINVALFGESLDGSGEVLRRDAGQAGDAVAVTGPLGAAAGALRLLQAGAEAPEALSRALLRPQARVDVGQRLLRAGVRCAMDISDGLLADLGKLCAASGLGAVVRLPAEAVHPGLRDLFGDEEARKLALSGGEDYELLACGPRPLLEDQGLTIVGELVPGSGVRALDEQGSEIQVAQRGYDAFAGRP